MEKIKTKIQFLVNLYKTKDLYKAEIYAKKMLRENPKIVYLYNILGLILSDLQKVDDAIDCFQRGIQVDPKNIDIALIYNNLGTIYLYRKNYFEAENCYKKALNINKNNFEAFNNLGNLFIKQNKYKEGIDSYKKAIEINKKFIAAHYNIGIAYKSIGNFSESKKFLLNAIEIKNDFFTAHRNLSGMTRYEKGNKHLKMMEKMFEDKKIPKVKKSEIAFALGKAYNDIKDFQKAFYYYNEGNDLRKKQVPFLKEKESEEFKMIKKVFTKNFIEEKKLSNTDSSIIFILGMPRSGTTLVEQIVSSHPDVFGGDEINFLPDLIKNKYENILNINNTNSETLTDISEQYIAFLKKISDNSKKITDKFPINFKWIGLIKILFPKSKILHSVRNPKDLCLSIYKNYFTNSELNFAYKIDDIVFFYNLYLDLMNYWKKVLPDFIIDVNYEDLVINSEDEIKKIIKSLNLKWNEKCIKFYKNERPVKTASDTQVRNKIYKSSINSWKNYEDKFIKSFKDLNI